MPGTAVVVGCNGYPQKMQRSESSAPILSFGPTGGVELIAIDD
jgi:hypothetical protein